MPKTVQIRDLDDDVYAGLARRAAEAGAAAALSGCAPIGHPPTMTRDEATARSDQLNREHPDRATHHWMAREAPDGAWTVVKVNLPGRTPVHASTAEKAPTPPPQDPRPVYEQNIGGPYGPG